MAKTNTEKSQHFRAAQKDKGLREVRGIWLKPEDHKEIKQQAKRIAGKY